MRIYGIDRDGESFSNSVESGIKLGGKLFFQLLDAARNDKIKLLDVYFVDGGSVSFSKAPDEAMRS